MGCQWLRLLRKVRALKHYVLVTGGRDYNDYETVEEPIRFLVGFYGSDLRIMHGGARGADGLAQRAVQKFKIPHRVFPADWEGPCRASCDKDHRRSKGKYNYCPAAGVYRNLLMAEYLDFCRDRGHSTQILAFPGGSGTINMILQAEDRNHPVDRFAWDD